MVQRSEWSDISRFDYINQSAQAQLVGAPTEANDLSFAYCRDHRDLAELFTRVDIREMHLDHR